MASDAEDYEDVLEGIFGVGALQKYPANCQPTTPLHRSTITPTTTLVDLPHEVILRILSVLSARDLISTMRLSHHMRRVSSDNLLWRRLYGLRYGTRAAQNDQPDEANVSWLRLYLDKDASEMNELRLQSSHDDTLFELIRVDLDIARERHPVDPIFESSNASLDVFGGTEQSRAIDAWRKKHQLAIPSPALPHHRCDATCRIEKLEEDLFGCLNTGVTHQCGEHVCELRAICKNDQVGWDSCPVSQQSWRRYHDYLDERAPRFGDEEDEDDEEEDMPRLAKAFLLGYDATAAELDDMFGKDRYEDRDDDDDG